MLGTPRGQKVGQGFRASSSASRRASRLCGRLRGVVSIHRRGLAGDATRAQAAPGPCGFLRFRAGATSWEAVDVRSEGRGRVVEGLPVLLVESPPAVGAHLEVLPSRTWVLWGQWYRTAPGRGPAPPCAEPRRRWSGGCGPSSGGARGRRRLPRGGDGSGGPHPRQGGEVGSGLWLPRRGQEGLAGGGLATRICNRSNSAGRPRELWTRRGWRDPSGSAARWRAPARGGRPVGSGDQDPSPRRSGVSFIPGGFYGLRRR